MPLALGNEDTIWSSRSSHYERQCVSNVPHFGLRFIGCRSVIKTVRALKRSGNKYVYTRMYEY